MDVAPTRFAAAVSPPWGVLIAGSVLLPRRDLPSPPAPARRPTPDPVAHKDAGSERRGQPTCPNRRRSPDAAAAGQPASTINSPRKKRRDAPGHRRIPRLPRRTSMPSIRDWKRNAFAVSNRAFVAASRPGQSLARTLPRQHPAANSRSKRPPLPAFMQVNMMQASVPFVPRQYHGCGAIHSQPPGGIRISIVDSRDMHMTHLPPARHHQPRPG